MEIPAGHKNINNDHILKLRKKFYGLCDENITWHYYCTKGLTERGFRSSKIDPCLFCKEGIVIVLYVDDCCIFGASKEKINEFTESLKRPKDEKSKKNYKNEEGGFDFTAKKSIAKFLVTKTSQSENIVTLRQPFLIELIVTAIGFQDKKCIANQNRRP